MHIKFYGLKNKNPKLIGKFRDRIEDNLQPLHYEWTNLEGIDEELEYISIHELEMNFSLKLKNRRAEKLTANNKINSTSSIFLYLDIVSDHPSKYCVKTNSPKSPYVPLPNDCDQRLHLKVFFSGKDYYLQQQLSRTLPKGCAVQVNELNGAYLKGLVLQSKLAKEEMDWPDGTLVIFHFPQENNKRLIKSFLIG